jgi:hypothetical protein
MITAREPRVSEAFAFWRIHFSVSGYLNETSCVEG